MDEQMRERFGFEIDDGSPRILTWVAGGCRPAWDPEIALWDALAALSQPAAQVDSSHSAGGECGGVPQWRPIETAPKDFGTTPFDVWTGFERLADCWWGVPTYPENVRKESGIVRLDSYDSNGPVVERVKNATLWIPLPAAPKATP